MSELTGYNRERSKYFQKVISQDLMHAFQNGFHLKKGYILFLRYVSMRHVKGSLLKLDNPALGHQIPHLVTFTATGILSNQIIMLLRLD